MSREFPEDLPRGNDEYSSQDAATNKIQDDIAHWRSVEREVSRLQRNITGDNLSSRQHEVLMDASLKGREFFQLAAGLSKEQKERLIEHLPEFKITAKDNVNTIMNKGSMGNLVQINNAAVEAIRGELKDNPAVLQSFDEWIKERRKLEGQTEGEKQALQDQRNRIERTQAVAEEQSKLPTFMDIANTRGNPGETRRVYNTQGDAIEIKYDQQGYTTSFNYSLSKEHARDIWEHQFRSSGGEFTDDIYKQMAAQHNGSYKFSNEKGFQYEGGELGAKFFSMDKHEPGLIRLLPNGINNKPAEPGQNLPLPTKPGTDKIPQPLDTRRDISSNEKLPAVSRESSAPLASINNIFSDIKTQANSAGSKAQAQGAEIDKKRVSPQSRESIQKTASEPSRPIFPTAGEQRLPQNPGSNHSLESLVKPLLAPMTISKFDEVQKSTQAILPVLKDKPLELVLPRNSNNPEKQDKVEHFDRSKAEASKEKETAAKPELVRASNRESGVEIRPVDPGDRHAKAGNGSAVLLRNAPGGRVSDGLNRISLDAKSAARLSDLGQISGRRLDTLFNDGKIRQLDLSGRRDIADKFTGPIQRGLGLKDGIKAVIVGSGKLIDEKLVKNGAGDKQADKSGKGTAQAPELIIRAGKIEDLRLRVLQLPSEVKDQAAKIADRLIKNSKDEIGGKDKELADAMRQLSKSELKILQLILKNGIKPDFSQFRPEAQNALILIFRILLTQQKILGVENSNSQGADSKGQNAVNDAVVKGEQPLSSAKTETIVRSTKSDSAAPNSKSDSALQSKLDPNTRAAKTEPSTRTLHSELPGDDSNKKQDETAKHLHFIEIVDLQEDTVQLDAKSKSSEQELKDRHIKDQMSQSLLKEAQQYTDRIRVVETFISKNDEGGVRISLLFHNGDKWVNVAVYEVFSTKSMKVQFAKAGRPKISNFTLPAATVLEMARNDMRYNWPKMLRIFLAGRRDQVPFNKVRIQKT